MKPEEAKQKLLEIFGSQLEFNKEFDRYFSLLKDNMQLSLISWCEDCKGGNALGSVPSQKKHKDKFVFFRKIGSDARAILIKVQNSDFIELSLVDHKEYDDIRKAMGYKKSSYYYS
jgi:hypothetical protein